MHFCYNPFNKSHFNNIENKVLYFSKPVNVLYVCIIYYYYNKFKRNIKFKSKFHRLQNQSIQHLNITTRKNLLL